MKKYSFIYIPLAAVLISSTLLFSTADKKLSDYFQRPLKSTAESPSVMMINVDDTTIEKIGNWPLPRDTYASAILNLKDLKARDIVFDLSFLDNSPTIVDQNYIEKELPDTIRRDFESLKKTSASVNQVENNVLINVSRSIKHVDQDLADSLGVVGNATLAITMVNYDALPESEQEFMETSVALQNVSVIKDTLTPEFKSISPAIPVLMHKNPNSGFVNADVDPDNYLRRLHLVAKCNGKYYGQLVFNSILKYYKNPEVVISNKSIVLKDAVIGTNDDGSEIKKNVLIPRSQDGSVIIKYPKKVYNGYKQDSLWNIYRLSSLEKDVVVAMRDMNENGLLSYMEDSPVDIYDAIDWLYGEILAGRTSDEVNFDIYSEYKTAWIESMTLALSDDNKNVLLESIKGTEDEAELASYINSAFESYSESLNGYIHSRQDVAKKVEGTICIIGTTATSTSDWGITQYEEHYPNPGVHYSLANMLLSRDFVDDSPVWISILAALIFCFCYSFGASKIKGTGRQILTGILATFLSAFILLVYFLVTRQYIGAVVPIVSVFFTFVVTTILGFLTASKDKKFITNAFSQCLSKEVVNEIVANPSSFKLGGQRLEMTAIFTDIQKFSGFSELLSASQLVALLNYYLTKMSDIIMDERGTVDKYEGDAIIALVGAPLKMDDHAIRAVSASLKMKAAEAVMNKEILDIAASPKPDNMDQDLYDAFTVMVQNHRTIFTRIGLNSGEMIAGYMGSENKKNYTMMGNNVNLASRLEGVNKQYSTGGILISEATRNLLGDRFVVRRLDRVRVVNVNTPIRLYEPLAERSAAGENLLDYVARWEDAVDLFETQKYDQALEIFKKLSEERPADNTAKYYIKLLENFFCKGKYPVEADGVGVEYMPEDGVFKLLQK